MSAETLRLAAADMRVRAEAAIGEDDYNRAVRKFGRLTPKGRYIEAMHPAVALAVADWLDMVAEATEDEYDLPGFITRHALSVARTYLGGAA